MSKPHKIKKYSDKTTFFPSKNKRNPLKLLLWLLVLVALIFLGISIYSPIKNFITGNTTPSPLPETSPPIITPQESTPEPEPPAPSKEERESLLAIKGMSLSFETASDPTALEEFLKNLPSGINTVVLTAKDSNGQIYFNTKVPQALKWEAVTPNALDIAALNQKLEVNSLNLAVRISVFSDPIAARGDFDNNAIIHSSGVLWIDNTLASGGKPWTNPYSNSVKEYNLAIANELALGGADIIILDNFHFPRDITNSATFKDSSDIPKAEALNTFYKSFSESLPEVKIAVSAEVSSVIEAEGGNNDQLFGGDPLALDINRWLINAGDSLTPENIDQLEKNTQKEFIFSFNKIPDSLKNKEYILTS